MMATRSSITRFALLGTLAVLSLSTPRATAAQSVQEILEAMATAYEERLDGINNYTVVYDVMGFETSTYFERNDDGSFDVASTTGQGAQRVPMGDYRNIARMSAAATYEGTEDVNGRSAHVIVVDDMSALADAGMQMEQGQDWEDMTMTMWIDEDMLVPLRMRMAGTMTMNGNTGDVTSIVEFDDYRDDEGLLQAYTTRVSAEGMGALMDMDEEQMEEMMRGLEEFQEQMERIPAAQRAMMERMMGSQLERMKEMLSSGAMNLTMTVAEVRVNAGPPNDA